MSRIATAPTPHAIAVDRLPLIFDSRWLRGYVRGKLGSDPLYPACFQRLADSAQPLLDIGCGTGLHAFYLRERGYEAPILGIDVDKGKILTGTQIAARHYKNLQLRLGDGLTLPDFSGNVVLLDVLHYIPERAQRSLLDSIRARVAPGCCCIIRTTPRANHWRFRATLSLEYFARLVRWMKRPALSFPTLEFIAAAFPSAEFEHEIRPLWGRTPFNSWLLTFRRR